MNFTKVASTTPRICYVKVELGKLALKSAFGAAVAMGVLGAGQAQAVAFVDVTVAGHKWRVSTFLGSYDDNIDKFDTPGAGGVMPWWGNRPLAAAFRDEVGNSIHLPPDNPNGQDFPWYGYRTGPDSVPPSGNSFVTFVGGGADGDVTAIWAQATKVPGPLPILGAAAAFGYSRKLRQRIKSSKSEVISTTAL